MNRHYHVVNGLPGGYIPNSIYRLDTARDAIRCARKAADDCREDGYSKVTVYGPTRGQPRYWLCVDPEGIAREYYVSIETCQEADCEDDSD